MKRAVFMGTPDFSVPVLERILAEGYDVPLVVTQPDRPRGRKKEMIPSPVKQAAEKHGIPVWQPEKLSDGIVPLKEAAPDIIITAAFGQLLPPEVLELPPYGCINVHASLLPEYRGGAPIHQAVIDGREETGITIMYMAEKLDAGDIIVQSAIPIHEDDTAGTMHDKLSFEGAELLLKALHQLEKGAAKRVPQNHEQATFAPNITREMERIDWQQPAAAVRNQIRGLVPWPVGYSIIEGIRLKLWEAEVAEKETEAAPGTVLTCSEGVLETACGQGTVIRLTKVQPAGGKQMSADTFLNGKGRLLEPGQRFESGAAHG
ncbi:methionyl-tRNA formyltransferase [Alkalicoccus luteus]|uniref:Methionyl-tRNA formyltransferase n=1 Tax=Alkalicoccus luteus TaxID=1237094 RepID=A0A969PVG7_9BACI|nr:methionyl-tRNA formyltransferase [Alkalicoccus luteus]NJP36407.1 methionyl-tRNA formyltransferase [Alkalicoccus luteus]